MASATGGLPIQELQPPPTNSLYGFIVMMSVAALALYMYQNKEKWNNPDYDAQPEFTRAYMTAGVLILACTHLRNLWFIILGATPTMLLVLKNIQRIKTEEEKIKYPFLKGVFYPAIIVAAGFIFLSNASYSPTTNADSGRVPIQALEYLENTENKEDLILYTEFDNGAFMEWHGYKVYMDARPELFQKNINGKEDIYEEYCNVKRGTIDYSEFLDKYQFTHMIVTDNTLLDMYISLHKDYEAVVDGNGYNLYERIK